MSIPYASASSGMKARNEISKILQHFGCESVGFMDNHVKKEVILAFTHHGRNIQLTANAKGWAGYWLKANPWSHRKRLKQEAYQQKALDQGVIAVNSILRDWVKGQVTAIETGILTFDHVFMPYMLMSDGRTMIEHVQDQNLLQLPDVSED